MSLQALDETARVPAKPQTAKRERFSPRLTEAVRLIASGACGTIKAASERVGMNYTHLVEQLKKPNVQAFIAREARQNISTATLRASVRFTELIDDESGHVAAKVCDRILTSEGILKSDDSRHVSVSVGVSVGYVINLARKADDPSHMPHMREIEAKPLKDNGSVQG